MAAMSSQSFGSPASYGGASSWPSSAFAGYGSSSGNPMSMFTGAQGMSASSLSNAYANSPSLMSAGYTPYYGRK